MLQHLIDTGAHLKAMTPEEVEDWRIRQDRLLIDHAGGDLASLQADAARALQIAGSHPWSALLADQQKAIAHDAWLVLTLANYWRSHERARRAA